MSWKQCRGVSGTFAFGAFASRQGNELLRYDASG